MTWQKIEPVDDTQKIEFTAVLKRTYIKLVGQLDTPMLALEFENKENPYEPLITAVFGVDQLSEETPDGWLKTKAFKDLGKLVKSFREFDVDVLIDLENEDVKTEPDTTGCTMTMTPDIRKVVDDSGTKDFVSWRVTQIIRNDQPGKPTPTSTNDGNASGATDPVDDDIQAKWEEFFFEHLTTPLSKGEIMRTINKTITDKNQRAAMNKARTQVLSDAIEMGVLVMPEPGKYQVAE